MIVWSVSRLQGFPGSEWERLQCVDDVYSTNASQSFWELHDPRDSVTFEARAAEAPELPPPLVETLKAAVEAVLKTKEYSDFHKTPGGHPTRPAKIANFGSGPVAGLFCTIDS
eukprot:1376733-Pyramimonas_sp.AAC.2